MQKTIDVKDIVINEKIKDMQEMVEEIKRKNVISEAARIKEIKAL